MEIFRAYDIRGRYPQDIDDDIAYKIGRCLASMFSVKTAVIGRDVSLASPNIKEAISRGLVDEGVTLSDLGIAGTDVVYFASGHHGFDLGIEVTASHSAGYLSGIKIVGPSASPFGQGSGMEELKERYLKYQPMPPKTGGSILIKDVWDDFINQAVSFVSLNSIKPLKVVVDASNAVGSLEIDHLEKKLPQITFLKINWELDGNYPGHAPNPILKENRKELIKKVRENKADFGVAFDGDADRIYFVDEAGDFIFGVYLTALIAERFCRKNPGRVILHDIRARRYIKKLIQEAGGIPKMELIGHSFFKSRMKKEDAIFGEEASGHVYYNFGAYSAENSIIALLQVMEIISKTGKSMRELTYQPRIDYPVIGEYNFVLPGFKYGDDLTPEALMMLEKIIKQVTEEYKDGDVSDFDTLTVYYPDWNFNLRPSANDPLIRFTAEAIDPKILTQKKEEMISLLKKLGCEYLDDAGVTVPGF